MILADNIRKFRKEAGISMEELGKRIGVSRQTVFRYENGTIPNIPPDKIQKIARVLRKTPGNLFGWDEEPPCKGAMPIVRAKLPLLGEIACGKPLYAEEKREYYTGPGDVPGA
ncbi:MAG: helix-turn-helix transcriptional regulator, partial [Clostridia bacterium]|nr:helix-turn-helix transcriptional regulator [Clostridia bacterium]